MAREGGTTVRDWKDKFAALQRISGETDRIPSIAFFLSAQHKNQAKSVHEALKNNLDKNLPNHGEFVTQFLTDAIDKIEFQVTFDDFCDLDFGGWLSRLPEKYREVASQGITFHQFPQVRFYPGDVVGSPVEDWEKTGAVDMRFMYDTRHAASAWERSRNHHVSRQSHQYTYCRDTLPKVLEHLGKESALVEEIILLGAGSPDKDWLILNDVLKRTQATVRLLICDGSFYMLAETFYELTSLLEDLGAANRVIIELFCFDFCNVAAWQICNLRRHAKRIIFLMGGTIGNIREDEFFEAIGTVFDKNTTLAIGASFYSSLDELKSSGEADINAQYGNAAKELVLSSVAKLLQDNYPHLKYKEMIGRVDKQFHPAQAGRNFPSIMSSRVAGTHGALFSFSLPNDEAIRLSNRPTVRRLYLAVSRRYVKSAFQSFVGESLNADTYYIDNPNDERFSYLIVRPKRESLPED